jgi:formylglycine-generating enzyme required for sulfatase activity
MILFADEPPSFVKMTVLPAIVERLLPLIYLHRAYYLVSQKKIANFMKIIFIGNTIIIGGLFMEKTYFAGMNRTMKFRKMNLLMLIVSVWFLIVGLFGCSSGDSSSPSLTITPPQQVTADGGMDDEGDPLVTLNWTPVADAASFNIYYSTKPGVTKTAHDKAILDIHGLTEVQPVIFGTKYYFVITSVDASGQESAISKEVSATPTATPAPLAPQNVAAATTGSGTVRITWSASDGATSYTVYYSTDPNMTTATASSKTNAVSPQDITGLTNNITYYFAVTATNANGESVISFVMNCVPLSGPPPSAPTGVTALEGNGQATISWTSVAAATSYNVYYSPDMFFSKTFGTKIPNIPPQPGTVSYTMASLTNKTAYFFLVTAVNANGESAESLTVSATPLAAAPIAGMVKIPAGSFQMGDNLDNTAYALPVHTVTISDFYIDKYDTTYDLWKSVYDWAVDPARGANVYSFDNPGKNGSNDMGTYMPVSTVNWYDVVKWCNARSEKEGKTPVYYTDASQTTTTVYRSGQVNVANNMVNWTANGYRLPTEAEWEKAARGGLVGKRYPWGNDLDPSDADYNMGRMVSIGLYPPNGYGLYDMAGNAFQWTWDWGTDADAYTNYNTLWGATDPHGPGSSSTHTRVRRGGAYAEGSQYLTCYQRVFRITTYAAPYFGFRSVTSLP